MLNNKDNFRKDINGLRAWAVVAVILFHFNVPGFSGGFVGVDIFFVISGYLMTSIITKGLVNNNFSIFSFYISRAVRILPALLVLCAALLVIAWFYLSPIDLNNHTKHTVKAINFTSNINFWKESGYFDTKSHEKLLLHTWSLSVEWQFYILLPLLLITAWKLKPSLIFLTRILIFFFFISITLSIYLSFSSPSMAFYFLHTRAWEMIAGGLVYLLANKLILSYNIQRNFEALGFILILFSILFINQDNIWPGYLALIPVIGTALILISEKQKSLFTGIKVIQLLGNWSYSLYLWHWPLAAALVQMNLSSNILATLTCLTLTILLGWLSFRYIETPIRKYMKLKNNYQNTILLGCLILALLLVNYKINKQKDNPSRIPNNVINIFNEASNTNKRASQCLNNYTNACKYGGKTLGLIVIGDSHAASLMNTIELALPNKKLHALDWSLNGCVTIKDIKKRNRDNYNCATMIDKKLSENINLDPKVPILIVNRTSRYIFGENESIRDKKINVPRYYVNYSSKNLSDKYLEDMKSSIINTACEFSKVRSVYMLRPIPELKYHVPNTMGKSLWYTGKLSEVSISTKDYYKRNELVWAAQDEAKKQCGIKILNPLPYLCSSTKCKGDLNGLPIYSDDNHLNQRGAKLLIPLIETIFN